jgi:hypothetical protein
MQYESLVAVNDSNDFRQSTSSYRFQHVDKTIVRSDVRLRVRRPIWAVAGCLSACRWHAKYKRRINYEGNSDQHYGDRQAVNALTISADESAMYFQRQRDYVLVSSLNFFLISMLPYFAWGNLFAAF